MEPLKTDWKSERVRALVSAAEDAVQRTRWVFLVLNLGCAVIITAQLNLYGTWVRHVRKRAQIPEMKGTYGPGIEDVRERLEKAVWDDLYNVSMPLIGIEYSADDLILLGPASMAVLTFWFVYAHRREDHCIADLRRIALDERQREPGLAAYIYYAVAHHFVFTTTGGEEPDREDNWLRKARGHVPTFVRQIAVRTKNAPSRFGEVLGHVPGFKLLKERFNKNRDGKPTRVLTLFLLLLTQVPWLASATVVLVTARSLFVPGIDLVLVLDKNTSMFDQLEPDEQREAVLRLLCGTIFTALTLFYCVRAYMYERSTRKSLVRMKEAALADLKTGEATGDDTRTAAPQP